MGPTDSHADERSSLLAQVQECQALLAHLAAIQRLIVDRRSVETILDAVVGAVTEMTSADVAVVRVLDPADPGRVTTIAAIGSDPLRRARQGDGPAGLHIERVMSEDQVVLVEASAEELDADFAIPGLGSAVYAPIHRAGEPIGVLAVAAKAGRPLDGREDPVVSSFAELATLAINHAKALEDAAFDAFHDALGLPNRALLIDRLSRSISRSRRLATDVGIFAVDIVDFASINDSLGHQLADELLKSFEARLRGALRPSDTVARLSADQFAVLAEDLNDHSEVEILARRIKRALQPPFEIAEFELSVEVSIGSATTGESAAERIRNAEIALRRSKSEGRGGHAVYEPEMHQVLLTRRSLEAEIRSGLTRGEFELAYQPIFELATERIVGLEALLRWNHPARGQLGPGEFIPLAEETGLISRFGDYVVERACRQIAIWRARYPALTDLYVSVNLSVLEIREERLVGRLKAALRDTQLDPSALRLEITESVLMEDSEESVRMLGRLKAIGVKLAIDDFGTGYSSLRYLQRLPVDVLKIDQYFVSGLGKEEGAEEIIRAILELARAFHLEAVAEGISAPDQRLDLIELGCRFGQGYDFSRPLSVERADAFLLSSGLISNRLAGDGSEQGSDPAGAQGEDPAPGARSPSGPRGPAATG